MSKANARHPARRNWRLKNFQNISKIFKTNISKLFNIFQHYSTLFNYIQHYSTNFQIVQNFKIFHKNKARYALRKSKSIKSLKLSGTLPILCPLKSLCGMLLCVPPPEAEQNAQPVLYDLIHFDSFWNILKHSKTVCTGQTLGFLQHPAAYYKTKTTAYYSLL